MYDVFPKFIIEDGNLIIGKCKFHNELVTDKDKVQGGGWFTYRREDNSFTLSGDSHEFGAAKLEDIQKAVTEKKVFARKGPSRNISDLHIFKYNTQSEIINL